MPVPGGDEADGAVPKFGPLLFSDEVVVDVVAVRELDRQTGSLKTRMPPVLSCA